MNFSDERRLAELRYKSQRNRNIVRAIWYTSSILPALFVGLNFERCREWAIHALGGRPIEQIAQPQQAMATSLPQPTIPQPERRRSPVRKAPAPVPRIVVEQPAIVRETPVVRGTHRERPKPVTPDFTVALDLNRKRQRFECPGVPKDSTLKVLPASMSARPDMEPEDGTIPVTITFAETQKCWIEITSEMKNGDVGLWLEYKVSTDDGRELPFTLKNIDAIRRRLEVGGKRTLAAIASMEAEKVKLDAWIDAPGTKGLAALGQAKRRVKELEHLIPAARQEVAAIKRNYDATKELLDLAGSLHGAKLAIVVGQSRTND